VPILTVLVDRPAEIRRWFQLVDVATDTTGLVTCETIPAYRANGPGRVLGGLSLAAPGPPREEI